MTSFTTIHQQKQNKIITVALEEFASNGYEKGSTNTIVKNAGISKGSLFKYFPQKSDLYIYLLDYCVTAIVSNVYHLPVLGESWQEKLLCFATYEYNFLIQEPLITRFLQKVYVDMTQTSNPVVLEACKNKVVECLSSIDVITGLSPTDDRLLIEHIQFIISGYNSHFHLLYQNICPDEVQKTHYISGLKKHLELIRR